MPRLARYVMWWALAGLVVPALTYLEAYVAGGGSDVAAMFWPAARLTMAIQPEAPAADGATVVAVTVISNVILYAVIGLCVWHAREFVRRRVPPSRTR